MKGTRSENKLYEDVVTREEYLSYACNKLFSVIQYGAYGIDVGEAMKNSSIFRGLANAGIIVTLVIASKSASILEDEELKSLQDADDATYLTIEQSGIDDPIEIIDSSPTPPSLIIPFGFGQEDLTQDNLRQIKKIAEHLIKTGKIFEIRGCTDSVGAEDKNFLLSNNRAQNVLNALEQYGVPVTRYMDESLLMEVQKSGGDVSRYYDDKGNLIVGQDRDIYGEGEDCPSLVDGEPDNAEQRRRVEIIPDPKY